MYRFHISYKDLEKNDKFLRGANVILQEDNIIEALRTFQNEYHNTEIQGVLRSIVE